MDAGVVEFKLCDKAFECETCEFNAQIRRQPESDERSAGSAPPPSSGGTSGREEPSAEQSFIEALRKRLRPLWKQKFPADRVYHRSHYWLRKQANGTCQFGVDHVAANLIHPVLSIVFPHAPLTVQRHDPFCWIVLTGGALPLRSPVDGVISQYNDDLKAHPFLLNTDPYEGGLILNIKLDDKKRGFSNFRQSAEAQTQIEQQIAEVEHSFLQAYHRSRPAVGTTLFDGGVRLENIEGILGPELFVDAVNGAINSAL
jgi:glycine cleavage system H protein